MEKKKDAEGYVIILKEHDYPINCKGSAGAMEASCIVKCFQRSVKINIGIKRLLVKGTLVHIPQF